MSNIAVQGIPSKWSLKQVRSYFEQDIPGQFKPMYFDFDSGKFKKTVYIQLQSGKHDPVKIMREINSIPKFKKLKLKAFVPKYVSQAHMGAAKNSKPKAAPKGNPGGGLQVSTMKPDEILIITHKEILTELQEKYTRLYNLSRKSPGNLLLANIARIIFERLNTIMKQNAEAASNCFKLTGYYRKLHPHFGDFQMILSTLHKLQDEHGVPRSELVESEMLTVCSQLYTIDNIPYEKMRSAIDKYSLKITKKVLEHVWSLDAKPHQMDTKEDVARKKVRQELKNTSMHLPSIIRQVVQNNLTPAKTPYQRIRIYGEPFLPSKEMMAPFTRKFQAVHIVRSDRMYNLLKMTIPPVQYSGLVAMDGTVIGGAKLVIRSSDIPLYSVPDSLTAEMKAAFGGDVMDQM